MESQLVRLVLFIHCILQKHYGKQQGVGLATSAHKRAFYTLRYQDALHRGRQGDHSTSKPQKFNILLIRSKPSVQSGN